MATQYRSICSVLRPKPKTALASSTPQTTAAPLLPNPLPKDHNDINRRNKIRPVMEREEGRATQRNVVLDRQGEPSVGGNSLSLFGGHMQYRFPQKVGFI